MYYKGSFTNQRHPAIPRVNICYVDLQHHQIQADTQTRILNNILIHIHSTVDLSRSQRMLLAV